MQINSSSTQNVQSYSNIDTNPVSQVNTTGNPKISLSKTSSKILNESHQIAHRSVQTNNAKISAIRGHFINKSLNSNKLSTEQKINLLNKHADAIANRCASSKVFHKNMTKTMIKLLGSMDNNAIKDQIFSNDKLWGLVPSDIQKGLLKGSLRSAYMDKEQKLDILAKMSQNSSHYLNTLNDEGGKTPDNEFRNFLDQFFVDFSKGNPTDKRIIPLVSVLGSDSAEANFRDDLLVYRDIKNGTNLETLAQRMKKDDSFIDTCFGGKGLLNLSDLSSEIRINLGQALQQQEGPKSLQLKALETCLKWDDKQSVSEQMPKTLEILKFAVEECRKFGPEAILTNNHKNMLTSLKNCAVWFDNVISQKGSILLNTPGMTISQGFGRLIMPLKEFIDTAEKPTPDASKLEAHNKHIEAAYQEIQKSATMQLKTFEKANTILQHYNPEQKTLNGLTQEQLGIPNSIDITFSELKLSSFDMLLEKSGLT